MQTSIQGSLHVWLHNAWKGLGALTRLKDINPLYADIDINQEWLEHGMTDDEELFSSLLETSEPEPMQCEATSSDTTQCEPVNPSTSCQLIDPVACGDMLHWQH